MTERNFQGIHFSAELFDRTRQLIKTPEQLQKGEKYFLSVKTFPHQPENNSPEEKPLESSLPFSFTTDLKILLLTAGFINLSKIPVLHLENGQGEIQIELIGGRKVKELPLTLSFIYHGFPFATLEVLSGK